MKPVILAAIATLAFASTAEANRTQPGNCAIYAEMTADTAAKDKRITDKSTIKALRKYAAAQEKLMKDGMAQTYEQSKAFGWDKATVDRKMKEGQDAIRAGFRSSTMEKNKVYMDHLMAVNNCAQSAKSEAELGQSKEEMAAALQSLYAVVSKG